MQYRSLHIIGSKTMGGAEGWFFRFLRALVEVGQDPLAIVRRGSEPARFPSPPVPLIELPLRSVWDPASKRRVARTIQRLQPDLVQTYMGRATRLTRLARRGGPVHIARLGGYYKLAGYRHAHAWIGNTKGLCDYLVRAGLPARRVFQVYNFQELPILRRPQEIDALRHALGVPADAVVLLTPGRFVAVKGHRYLLEAMARLPASIGGRPLRLVLLGDGVLAPALHRQARQAGIEHRVVWAGWQTDPGPYYQMADLVVFPSLERETFGNVVVEAWAYQRPLVVASFRGAREITRHGIDAWRVPCEDPRALTAAIRYVLQHPGLAAELAGQGLLRVRAEFAKETVVGRYLEIYRTLLG